MKLQFPNDLEKFKFFCQKVLPTVYGNEISYYEVLCKLAVHLNEMVENMEKYEQYLNEFDITYEQVLAAQKEIQKEIEKIKKGEYFDQYVGQLGSWIDNNLQLLVSKIVTYVTFGLTMDGHFAAYIPKTWDFLQFDTNMDPKSPLYGRLILSW